MSWKYNNHRGNIYWTFLQGPFEATATHEGWAAWVSLCKVKHVVSAHPGQLEANKNAAIDWLVQQEGMKLEAK